MCYNSRVASAPALVGASPFMCAFCAFFASRLGLRDMPDASAGRARLPSLPRDEKGAPMGQVVLVYPERRRATPPKSSHPTQLLSRQYPTPLNPLVATHTHPPSMCCKQTTYAIPDSFRCNTYKKHRGGHPSSFIFVIGRSVHTAEKTAAHSPGKLAARPPKPAFERLLGDAQHLGGLASTVFPDFA
jgi:hypothetical protein